MGKRQIGEMQLSELVTTLLISEAAAYPITDSSVPLVYGIIPLITLFSAEIILSFFTTKSNFLKKLLDTSPCILISKGVLDQKKLSNVRLTLDELLAELRLGGYPDISSVDYAILEPSGRISVIAKPSVSAQSVKIAHTIIINGEVNTDYLSDSGKDAAWLDDQLAQFGAALADVFLMTVNPSDEINIIMKANVK